MDQSEYWVGEAISRVEEPYTHARVVSDIIFNLVHWLFIGWYVLEVYDSLREFGERGVNHLLCSTRLHSAKL